MSRPTETYHIWRVSPTKTWAHTVEAATTNEAFQDGVASAPRTFTTGIYVVAAAEGGHGECEVIDFTRVDDDTSDGFMRKITA